MTRLLVPALRTSTIHRWLWILCRRNPVADNPRAVCRFSRPGSSCCHHPQPGIKSLPQKQTSMPLDLLFTKYARSTVNVHYRLIYTIQVLTGETPFPEVRIPELVFPLINGLRPTKPANASAIGFLDPLWEFTQRCWSSEIGLRPKVTEVVTCLAEAVANWHEPMPPCSQSKKVNSAPKVPISDLADSCECEIILFHGNAYRMTIQTPTSNHPMKMVVWNAFRVPLRRDPLTCRLLRPCSS